MQKNKNILIVGAGVHGCFLAKYLSNYNVNIFLIEKTKDICLGSSGATHNRANRGFHYPRSKQTTNECKIAYNYFEKNYNRFLKKFQSYYCIEKNSKTSFSKYVNFFNKNKLKFKIINKTKHLKKEKLEGIIRAEEGCYDHRKIKIMLKNKLSNKKIKIIYKFDLKKVLYRNGNVILISKKNKIFEKKVDIILNATYDNSNMVLRKFIKKAKIEKYKHQLTEVVRIKCKKKYPGITIMDGPYATIMPHLGKTDEYLLYDVTNSILKTSIKPILNKFKKTNYTKIKKKLSKYINFTNDFKYVGSNYGNRPVPYRDKEANRSTKIVENIYNKNIKLITIREGKYISAPYISRILSKKIIKYLNEK
jgi:flavin-dependent dehydrogenase